MFAALAASTDLLTFDDVCLDYLKTIPAYIALAASNPSYKGCYSDMDQPNRDLPMYKGTYISKTDCADMCAEDGFAYMGRQDRRECWCGDSYGKHGTRNDCNCDANQIGVWRNCIYSLEPAAREAVKLEKELRHTDETFKRCYETFRMDSGHWCHESTMYGRLTTAQIEAKKTKVDECKTKADAKAKVSCLLSVYDEFEQHLGPEGKETLARCLDIFAVPKASPMAEFDKCDQMAAPWLTEELSAVGLTPPKPDNVDLDHETGRVFWFTRPASSNSITGRRRTLYETCRKLFAKAIHPTCKQIVDEATLTAERFTKAYLALDAGARQEFDSCREVLSPEAADKCWDVYLTGGQATEGVQKCDGCGCCLLKVFGRTLKAAPVQKRTFFNMCTELSLETVKRNCLEVELRAQFGNYQTDLYDLCVNAGIAAEDQCIIGKLTDKFKALPFATQAELHKKCYE